MPRLRLAAPFAAAALAAGAGLYLGSGAQGNLARAEPVEIAPGVVETDECRLDDATRERLDAAATGEVAAMQTLERGLSLASMEFEDREGKATRLSDLGDGTKLLNLWATWCAPCRAEMPHLDDLAKSGDADGSVEVVALNVDTGDADKPLRFLEEIGIENLDLYREPTMRTFSALRMADIAVGLPVTILLDGESCVLAAMNGPAVWNSADALGLIEAAAATR